MPDEISQLAMILEHESILYAIEYGIIPYIGHAVNNSTPERRKIVDKLLNVIEDIQKDLLECQINHKGENDG